MHKEEKPGMEEMKAELVSLLCKKSFKYTSEPSFRLVSGKLSRFYVDCKPVTLSPRGAYLAGSLVFSAIRDAGVIAAGGLTFGADPIAVATAVVSEIQGNPIKAFSIRKEKKGHGTGKWVEGDLKPGDRVAILEDVVTTGGSTIKAITRAEEQGLVVCCVIILVDRMEGGTGKIREKIKDVRSIVTIDDLMACAGHTP